MAGQPRKDTKRVSFRAPLAAWRVITQDMRDKGYVGGNGLKWGAYIEQWAGLIASGNVNINKLLDDITDSQL